MDKCEEEAESEKHSTTYRPCDKSYFIHTWRNCPDPAVRRVTIRKWIRFSKVCSCSYDI